MLDEKLFDYNRYIQEHLKEIDDLEERRYAKEILLEGLANIFSLSEKRYHDLEMLQGIVTIPCNYLNKKE